MRVHAPRTPKTVSSTTVGVAPVGMAIEMTGALIPSARNSARLLTLPVRSGSNPSLPLEDRSPLLGRRSAALTSGKGKESSGAKAQSRSLSGRRSAALTVAGEELSGDNAQDMSPSGRRSAAPTVTGGESSRAAISVGQALRLRRLVEDVRFHQDLLSESVDRLEEALNECMYSRVAEL